MQWTHAEKESMKITGYEGETNRDLSRDVSIDDNIKTLDE
jgi:hypothetical protein